MKKRLIGLMGFTLLLGVAALAKPALAPHPSLQELADLRTKVMIYKAAIVKIREEEMGIRKKQLDEGRRRDGYYGVNDIVWKRSESLRNRLLDAEKEIMNKTWGKELCEEVVLPRFVQTASSNMMDKQMELNETNNLSFQFVAGDSVFTRCYSYSRGSFLPVYDVMFEFDLQKNLKRLWLGQEFSQFTENTDKLPSGPRTWKNYVWEPVDFTWGGKVNHHSEELTLPANFSKAKLVVVMPAPVFPTPRLAQAQYEMIHDDDLGYIAMSVSLKIVENGKATDTYVPLQVGVYDYSSVTSRDYTRDFLERNKNN